MTLDNQATSMDEATYKQLKQIVKELKGIREKLGDLVEAVNAIYVGGAG